MTPALSQLWRFNAEGEGFSFAHEQAFLPSESVSSSHTAKNWGTLFRPKLNLAWLPAQNVFLRVVHLPTSDPVEIASMIEIQLEKLSPLPITQVVWGMEILPKPASHPEALQAVIVVMVAREVIEQFLGTLENKGFLSDSLEVPCIDQLLQTKVDEDGVWIYMGGTNGESALVAWWHEGVLQNLALITLSKEGDKENLFKTQIEQMAWAGELDGWLSGTPTVHLVAEPAEVAIWEPAMRKWADNAFKVIQPSPLRELAASCAARAVRPQCKTNLIPPDYVKRYQQKIVDGLWMRGLMAVLAVYALGVVVYMAALFVLKNQADNVQTQVKGLSGSYTNAIRNKERIQIIKERQELKYAALDCWKAVAQCLPESMTLEQLNFQKGKLDLRGTVLNDSKIDVESFHSEIKTATLNGELLFKEVGDFSISGQGEKSAWKFTCTLKGAKN